VLAVSLTEAECGRLRGQRGQGGPVSDHTAELEMAVRIALWRAREGGAANLGGHWLDSGHPDARRRWADALDKLTSAGLLVLGDADPESCGVHRVMVTDSGCTRYVALCQIHNPAGQVAVRTPHCWARPARDQRSHLLADRGTDQIGVLIAVCGHRMPWSVTTTDQPTERSCLTCEVLATGPVPAPPFGNSPDSGRPPVEQSPPADPRSRRPAGPHNTGELSSPR